MSDAKLKFIEITVKLEPNTSQYSILASEDPHATHKVDYSAATADLDPEVLAWVLLNLFKAYQDPAGTGLVATVKGDRIIVPPQKGGAPAARPAAARR
jgi:hypothetical protein